MRDKGHLNLISIKICRKVRREAGATGEGGFEMEKEQKSQVRWGKDW